jgi:methionine-rich copper-binding protein CopC
MRVRAPRGDRSAPQLQQTTPADNATDVPVNANLILTFNEAVKAGVGNIVIRDADGNSCRASTSPMPRRRRLQAIS